MHHPFFYTEYYTIFAIAKQGVIFKFLMIAFTLSIFGQLVKNDVLDKNNAVCQSLANGNPLMTATQLPTMPVMMRRGRRGRRRRRWRHEMPTMMMMVMMMVVVVDTSTVHVSSGRVTAPCGCLRPLGKQTSRALRRPSHSDPRDCNSRKSGDEFDLVHCRVPSVFAQAHSRAYTELGLITGIF